MRTKKLPGIRYTSERVIHAWHLARKFCSMAAWHIMRDRSLRSSNFKTYTPGRRRKHYCISSEITPGFDPQGLVRCWWYYPIYQPSTYPAVIHDLCWNSFVFVFEGIGKRVRTKNEEPEHELGMAFEVGGQGYQRHSTWHTWKVHNISYDILYVGVAVDLMPSSTPWQEKDKTRKSLQQQNARKNKSTWHVTVLLIIFT